MEFDELRQEAYLEFHTSQFPFRELLCRIFSISDLEKLHETLPNDGRDFPFVTFENDQSTVFHKTFYGSPYFEEFLQLYQRFVQDVIAPMFADRRIVFQARPTFRVSLPNNVAVGSKHRDGDYYHPPSEINFWMPFTRVWDSNGFYVETQPDRGDFHPLQLQYGQMFRFYGNRCWHYNEMNRTGVTRVSIDFRVVPGSLWQDAAAPVGETVKSRMRFVIGSYYAEYARGQADGAAPTVERENEKEKSAAATD